MKELLLNIMSINVRNEEKIPNNSSDFVYGHFSGGPFISSHPVVMPMPLEVKNHTADHLKDIINGGFKFSCGHRHYSIFHTVLKSIKFAS